MTIGPWRLACPPQHYLSPFRPALFLERFVNSLLLFFLPPRSNCRPSETCLSPPPVLCCAASPHGRGGHESWSPSSSPRPRQVDLSVFHRPVAVIFFKAPITPLAAPRSVFPLLLVFEVLFSTPPKAPRQTQPPLVLAPGFFLLSL